MKVIKYPNLVAEMARRGESQTTISKLLGKSIPSVSKRFSGVMKWNIDEIDKVCEHYGKSYEELFK